MKKSKQMDIDEVLNESTGEITPAPQFNQVIEIRTIRENGTLDIGQDFRYCPSMTEQHTAHLTDINYLMSKHKPDEIAQFIAARATRPEIVGHDFSQELNLQDARNVVYNAKKLYSELDPKIQSQFSSPLEFIKFIDNPANAEKMVEMGLLKRRQVENLSAEPNQTTTQPTTTTKEKAKDS